MPRFVPAPATARVPDLPLGMRRLRAAARLLPGAAGALLLLPALSNAAPALPRWNVQEIPTFGGTASVAYAINDSGWVTGYATQADGSQRGYVWKPDGSMAMIPTLGGSSSVGRAINRAGQVGGWSARANGVDAGFIYDPASAGFLVQLTGQPSNPTYVLALNNRGEYTGYSGQGSDVSPFIGTPTTYVSFENAGTGQRGYGLAVNDNNRTLFAYLDGASQVYSSSSLTPTTGRVQATLVAMNYGAELTGRAVRDSAFRPVAWRNGVDGNLGLDEISTPSGGAGSGYAINDRGQIVGSYFAGNALFDGSGRALAVLDRSSAVGVDLNTQLPAASGWLLQDGAGINENYQIAGTGVFNGQQRGYVMSLDGVVWRQAGSGNFQDGTSWSFGLLPSGRYAAIIDPSVSATVTLPAGLTTARGVQVGGTDTFDIPTATLALGGGTLDVTGSATGVTITPRGIVTGEGTVRGNLLNQGRLLATNLALTGSFTNAGRLGGNSDPDQKITATAIVNDTEGRLQVAGGRTVELRAAIPVGNSGQIDVRSGSTLLVSQGGLSNGSGGQVYLRGGDLVVTDRITNQAGGRIQLEGGVLRAGDFVNQGQVEISNGNASLHGAVANASGGRIIVSGTAGATFYGDFEAQDGSELRVSSAATAVFFGAVQLRSGALLTGSGAKFFEGTVDLGKAADRVLDAGSVSFGNASTYTARIGAAGAGTGFDQYVAQGLLNFGGTLKLVSSPSFAAQVGQSFDLFDWGSSAARFARIDASGLQLADGAVLDFSRLYVDGTVSVTAVPEPAGWALLLGGLALLRVRRGGQRAVHAQA